MEKVLGHDRSVRDQLATQQLNVIATTRILEGKFIEVIIGRQAL